MRLLPRIARPSTALLCVLSAAITACGRDETIAYEPDAGDIEDVDAAAPDAAAPVDPSEVLFPSDRVLEVDITLDASDWAVLREQPETIGMPKATCGHQPTEQAYTYFPGTITIDGVTVENVGVRKKGNLGSLSSGRPGLKIKANEFVRGQRIAGLEKLTLNNNNQDASLISQCLGYGLFAAAGVAASRCSFAHVTVNGEDLGLYSNVESIDEDFLERRFADGTGRLYESGGEFVPGATDGFQPKVDEDDPDCSDLPPVATALQVPDSELRQALDAVVDVDAFIRYWAMEVITDHWDGYANNRNNFFFYHDPSSDQFQFIPWGIDALFTGRARTTRPDSVFACGSMAWRLYAAPETRALYLAELRELLGSVWDEPAILAEIDRMQALIEPIADPTGALGLAGKIQDVRDFVGARRTQLMEELDAGDPVWPFAAGEASCRIDIGALTATFDTSWDTLDDWAAGSGTLDGMVAGVSLTSSNAGSNAGLVDEGRGIIQLFAALDDGRLAVVYVIVQDVANVTPGTMPIDLVNVAAIMTFYDPETDVASGGGLLLGGSLTLTSADAAAGARIVGSLLGDVYEL